MSREHPTLFSAPMVRAILDGRKTQTRRIVTRSRSLVDGGPWPKDAWEELDFANAWVDPSTSPAGNRGPYLKAPRPKWYSVHRVYPRWWSGDRLWCKETWQPIWAEDSPPPHGYDSAEGWKVGYVATDGIQEWRDVDRGLTSRCMPSIFMPRALSRITLEITGVRVERVQSIGEEDALAEGITRAELREHGYAEEAFRRLWEKINGADSWAANPWVWCLEFRRMAA